MTRVKISLVKNPWFSFQLLFCLCSCFCKDKSYNKIGDGEKVRMAETAESRYNAVPARVARPPTVTTDLYQNVSSPAPPPSYSQATL